MENSFISTPVAQATRVVTFESGGLVGVS